MAARPLSDYRTLLAEDLQDFPRAMGFPTPTFLSLIPLPSSIFIEYIHQTSSGGQVVTTSSLSNLAKGITPCRLPSALASFLKSNFVSPPLLSSKDSKPARCSPFQPHWLQASLRSPEILPVTPSPLMSIRSPVSCVTTASLLATAAFTAISISSRLNQAIRPSTTLHCRRS